MKNFSRDLALCVCLVLFGGQGSTLLAQPFYKQTVVVNGGTIEGTVVLAGSARTASSLNITKDQKYCGTARPSPTLTTGRNNGIGNAVVYLEGVTEGKKWDSSKTAVLDQEGCRYTPHVSIIRAGTPLDIVNKDPILHNVHLYNFDSVDQTICNIAQPVKGQRTRVDQVQSVKARFLHATCDAGHPWMSAYIVRATHPYYTLSDANGRFRLDNVPPGTYRITMWHEGIAITKMLMENGKVSKYYFEEPYVTTKDVVVPKNGAVQVDFTLAVR